MASLLQLTEIAVAFGGVQALAGVSFDVAGGEVHALLGENGAGKSTLVRVMTGAVRAGSGTVAIDEQVVAHPEPSRMRALGVAPIYQQPALLPDLSVVENLAFGLERGRAWGRIDWRARRARARDLLARVGCELDLDQPAGSLRMAEQQLLEIARALGSEARVLILDEPTAALTDVEAVRLFALVRALRADGVGCVYISHRLDEVTTIADRATVLRDGKHVATRPMGELTRGELVRLMVGRDVASLETSAPPPADARDVLTVTGLSCRAARIAGVSLRVRAGEIVGLAGLVGAGRTELARALFGAARLSGGTVTLADGTPLGRSPHRSLSGGLALVPESRKDEGLLFGRSAIENTTLSRLARLAKLTVVRRGLERKTARTMLDRCDVRGSYGAPVQALSGGNQQKVLLARTLLCDPQVLIADEPTRGVDVGAKRTIYDFLAEFAASGRGVIVISSELEEVLGLAHRILVMRRGRIVAHLAGDDMTENAILRAAFADESAAA
jgi:rhamnose transport system ATP-binding protein